MPVRVRNVTATTFEVQLDEWEYLDGAHSQESVHYLVMEAGSYQLANGTVIEAGTLVADHTWTDHRFAAGFTESPYVFTSVISSNDPVAVGNRIDELSRTGFRVKLKEQERYASDPSTRPHGSEHVSYVAISGSGDVDGLGFEVASFTTGTITSSDMPIPIAFGRTDLAAPVLLTALQSNNGGNSLAMRYSDLTAAGANAYVEEDMSIDTETRHVSEELAYLAFANAATFELVAAPTLGGEVGQVTLAQLTSSDWTTVTLERTYHNAVVVVGPVTRNDSEPVTPRVRNVTGNSFQVQLDEWDYLDGTAWFGIDRLHGRRGWPIHAGRWHRS